MKKLAQFLERAFLALILAAGAAPIAPAAQPDVHISGASYYVTLASGVPWAQLGANYIFTPESPQVGVCLFIENQNPTSGHAITITAYQSGNPSLTSYAANPNLWAASTLVGKFNSVAASSVASMYINASGAANVAIVISGTTALSGTPDTANVFMVQVPSQQCGSAGGAPMIQGAATQNGPITGINPVLICGTNSGQCDVPIVAQGGWDLSMGGNVAEGSVNTQEYLEANSNGAIPTSTQIFSQKTSLYDTVRDVDRYFGASATAAGNTAIETLAGMYFRLLCVSVDVTGDAAQASAGDLTIQLEDGTTAMAGFTWNVFVPAASLAGRNLYSSGTVCFPNGYKSIGVGNTLNVNLSSALTSGKVTVRAWGSAN